MMSMQQNYFQLFGLNAGFRVDQALLSDKYRQLQRQIHPDKYAGKSDREQRLAVQFAAYVNTAYETLKSPLLRAEYLLSEAGKPIDQQSTTLNDGEFLMLQMQWRESLGELAAAQSDSAPVSDETERELNRLNDEVQHHHKLLLSTFEQQYNENALTLAQATIAKMHFVEKMLLEIEQLDAALFD